MRHVVILGAGGQLGTDLRHTLVAEHVTALTHADLDVCNGEQVASCLDELSPDVVINTAAFHRVDACEDDPARSFAVNAAAPLRLARRAEQQGFTFVHFSTDYVFGGRSGHPYREDDLPEPLNVYGTSKLAGEHLVRRYCRRHFVIRTAGLYGRAENGEATSNFVESMLRHARRGSPLHVVDDQITTPTASIDLARAVADLLDHERNGSAGYGLYHVTNAGQCSWYEFARTIFALCRMEVDLRRVSSEQYGARARRPAYSVLDHGKWLAAGLSEPPHWRDSLAEYLRAVGCAR